MKHPASFRDPSGFMFSHEGVLYRQINLSYKEQFELFESSGLYEELTNKSLLIPHEVVEVPFADEELGWKVIKPQLIPLVTFPYEWCFSQLKAAALLTLQIQKKALAKGMTLKDCSAYNVQFIGAQPHFIDTLSFDIYKAGEPWVAYQQFCRHFLAPLALATYCDYRLQHNLSFALEGLPLDLTSKLLPKTSWLRFGLLTHIHMHANFQGRYSDSSSPAATGGGEGNFSKTAFLGMIESLEGVIEGLEWTPAGTVWGDYYDDVNYTEAGFAEKRKLVRQTMENWKPEFIWDVGGNTGEFSRAYEDRDHYCLSSDIDLAAVEKNFRRAQKEKDRHLIPLMVDVTSPTPAIGWNNKERSALLTRVPKDTALALALIHHLAIANNTPLPEIAEFFASICNRLLIEFVPKSDKMVQKLLSSREDIFDSYTAEGFENAFTEHFVLEKKMTIEASQRVLYAFKKRSS